MMVNVIGLGYIGLPTALMFAKSGVKVIATDYNEELVSSLAEGKLTPRAVVAVDFIGNPADYEALRKVTNQYHLLLIEDAAQGIGAIYHGVQCGSLGDVGATSFFPSKPLGCYGDGGAVFTDSDEIAAIIRSIHVHGQGKNKYDNVRIGMNARLDTIQAAVLLPKLDELPNEIEKRQKIAERYEKGLAGYVITPYIERECTSAYAQYVVLTRSKREREQIRTRLTEKEIPTIVYYPTPMHKLPVFVGLQQYGECFNNTERYSECAFGIPFSPYITVKDQKYVIEMINLAINMFNKEKVFKKEEE